MVYIILNKKRYVHYSMVDVHSVFLLILISNDISAFLSWVCARFSPPVFKHICKCMNPDEFCGWTC